ncbi:hypothetical protein MSG28_010295 [Choristoneura fumiferana]|uniref:Uncharacterized protein n=1 Tax=Choristoneura fumiferana TaxID=7141 RepID=A0ACC0KJU5_CHOFU|nr:hypothetical protein MSG28_010295 [Choristoneura fumiferana]
MKGWFDAFREEGGPTLYAYHNRTAVAADVPALALLVAALTLYIAFLAIFPGIRKERFSTFTIVTLSLFVGTVILEPREKRCFCNGAEHLTCMEKDTTNYMQHKLGFSKKILLTNEAVPSKFHCQKDRKRLLSDDESAQEVFLKRKRIELVRECLQSQSATETQKESLKKDDDIVQEIIKPEEILRTQDKDTVTDSIITAEKTVQARIKRNVHYRSKAIQTICQSKSITTSPLKGFGGRTSDVTIVENSKFLDELQIGSCILADRGFKHLEQKLHEKAMKLLRPPSSAPNFCLSSSLLYQVGMRLNEFKKT